MLRIVAVAVVLAIAGAPAAHAEDTASTDFIAHAPRAFSFVGTWNCEGTFGNGRSHASRYEGQLILGGRWLELGEVDTQPAGYQARYLFGMSGDGRHVVGFDVNNFGSAIYQGSGWQDDTLTMTSEGSGSYSSPAPVNRFVFQARASDRFEVTWQVKGKESWPTGGDHLVCRRMP